MATDAKETLEDASARAAEAGEEFTKMHEKLDACHGLGLPQKRWKAELLERSPAEPETAT